MTRGNQIACQLTCELKHKVTHRRSDSDKILIEITSLFLFHTKLIDLAYV